MNIKPHYFNLKIDKDLWTKFMDKVPRSDTINRKLVELIERFTNGQ